MERKSLSEKIARSVVMIKKLKLTGDPITAATGSKALRSPSSKSKSRKENTMKDFEKLVLDYDEFEYNYDTYVYGDAFSDRDEAREAARTALLDPGFRQTIIDRLQEIADEDDEHTAPALELINRIKVLNRD